MAGPYDVIIVGSGFAGSYLAYQLGMAKKKVLIVEAGPTHRSREDYMENFFLNTFKAPESPYPPNALALNPAKTNVPRPTIPELVIGLPDQTKSYLTYTPGSLPFASTYERIGGGTGNHWMGTCLRYSTNDLKLKTLYGHGLDWPLTVTDLNPGYAQAEAFIGVSADANAQRVIDPSFPPVYDYPMPALPISRVDQIFTTKVTGTPLTNESYAINQTIVTQTPAGRNSRPYQGRRACHGNTNCTPICPIQAKFDTTYAIQRALDTGYVDIMYKTVVDYVTVDTATSRINGVHYLTYNDITVPAASGATGSGTLTAKQYVLAAHAIENAKILLNSARVTGVNVANSSGLVGCNLMDHPTYLAWGLMPEGQQAYGYRGPLSTAGIESLRDGPFRSNRAAWRIEIGNEGWNWPTTDPYTSGLDYVYGTNNGGLNPSLAKLTNRSYWTKLNNLLTRQFRVAFLVEQDPESTNRVKLHPSLTDNLGIPRPLLTYNLSDYTKAGFAAARTATTTMMQRLGATEYTVTNSGLTSFTYQGQNYNYNGAGHVVGTHIMGTAQGNSVVTRHQQSWDHANLWLVGCGSFPTVSTQNPTLTLMALTYMTAEAIKPLV